jgi:hypothetical protein
MNEIMDERNELNGISEWTNERTNDWMHEWVEWMKWNEMKWNEMKWHEMNEMNEWMNEW